MLINTVPPFAIRPQLFGIGISRTRFLDILVVQCRVGLRLGSNDGSRVHGDSPGVFGFLLAWVAMTFVSILVHELGHTFAFKRFGVDSSIELYHMGGLAIPAGFGSWRGLERGDWGRART